ncbi:MAG: hypothetical protein RL616_544 [Verrucomicrobiota bacterium]|jgi:hypothetical protein
MKHQAYKSAAADPTGCSCRALMIVSKTATASGSAASQTATANSLRATTITVVLAEILAQRGYPHGGLNE